MHYMQISRYLNANDLVAPTALLDLEAINRLNGRPQCLQFGSVWRCLNSIILLV